MSVNSVLPQYPVFTDVDGDPLENGYIYIGTAGLNAEASPITAYWDAEKTQVAAQPIRTLGGYPSRSGSPSPLYVSGDFSIIVKDKNGALVHSSLNDKRVGVLFTSDYSGGVERSVVDKLQDWVSVFDFIPVSQHAAILDRSSTYDATADIQAALDTKRHVYMPGGVYNITSTLEPYRQQIIAGEGGVQRGYLNERSVTRINVSTDTTAFDTVPNIAVGCQFLRLAIIAEDQTNGSGAYGIKMGTSASDPGGGSNQALKIRLEDLEVSGFDICYGHFGWSWEVTYNRCFADYPRTYGFHIGGDATIVTMNDCSVLQAGFARGTAGANGNADSYRIEGAQVYLHSPRAENSQDTGFAISGAAKVTIDSIYCEGNRLNDIALAGDFSGELVINGGRMIHDNSGVTTFACISNKSYEKCYIYANGIEYKLGPVTNNATTSGFYYAEDTTPYAVIEGLNVGSDVSKMSVGNKRVVYLSQSGRYAPAEFTVTDLPRVRFYRSGTSHIAKINTGALPTTLNISDGTNTHDMLTNGSIAEVSGRKYVWNATKGAWALMSPRTYANINYKNSNDAPSNWWGTHQGTDIVRFGGGSATTTVVIDTTGANVGATYFVKTQSSVGTPSTITINDQNGSLIYTLTPSFAGAGSVTATFAYYDRDGVGSGFQLVDKFRGD